jgi:Predicted transcriptional regulators
MSKNLLIKLRGKKSRSVVAKDLGVSPQGLGMIERGERTPRPVLMKKIADYYEKSVGEIFFGEKRNDSGRNKS